MVQDGFRVLPTELVAAARQALAETMGQLGECWGGDEQGQRFAATYLPHRQRLDEVVAVLAQGLASVDPALHGWADGLETTDRLAMPTGPRL